MLSAKNQQQSSAFSLYAEAHVTCACWSASSTTSCGLKTVPVVHLALQVQEWKLKCEAIEKREAERRESELKKHKEEVAYLENYAKQLKGQLETFVTPAKKGTGAGAAALAASQPVMQAA